MLGFKDITKIIGERNDARMNFRTKPRIKKTIQAAAALSGVDDSVFTMNAAYKAALETLDAHEKTNLKTQDHQSFFDALDTAPEPTQALTDAFSRHQKTITSL